MRPSPPGIAIRIGGSNEDAGRVPFLVFTFPTFDNRTGGNVAFKALGHPLTKDRVAQLLERLSDAGPVAMFDPWDQFASFHAFYDLSRLNIVGRFVQSVDHLATSDARWPTRPVHELQAHRFATLLVAAFDSDHPVRACRPLIRKGTAVASFDELRLPDELLTNPNRYLDPLNFATNWCLFRDFGGRRSILRTRNYWSRYGAERAGLWLCLFDPEGQVLSEWTERPAAGGTIEIDARAVRERFGLAPFQGSLFVHAIGVAGHDVVKYVLDDIDDAGNFPTVTHDSNVWPADWYAGVPAPDDDEEIYLWIQNCHPTPIPAGAVGLRHMGQDDARPVTQDIPAFGTRAVNLADLLPAARWPEQLEVFAGKHFVRPRYEIRKASGGVVIAHANVERVDLKPDPRLAALEPHIGKGFILPAPILPLDLFRSICLPTPMATSQEVLPIAALLYDSEGQLMTRYPFGRLPRNHAKAICANDLLAEIEEAQGFDYGHLELVYDFGVGAEADGWLHALFRYHRLGGHSADTSFGSHIFNTAMIYRDEPQSYLGHPPGLSTRLYLRILPAPLETFCFLIYPASKAWWPKSETRLSLVDRTGRIVAERMLHIPCGGSRLVRWADLFDAPEKKAAGPGASLTIDDRTCRLFGYHGALGPTGAFCLDHMFGF